ncbi:MAG: hypothetical protein ACFE9C_15450, partial [Candidatus Hodarchaeota archaeon]
AFTFPYLGYVKEPIEIVSEFEEADVVAYTPQGVPAYGKIEKIIRKSDVVLIKRFERNGKFVEVYVRSGV